MMSQKYIEIFSFLPVWEGIFVDYLFFSYKLHYLCVVKI